MGCRVVECDKLGHNRQDKIIQLKGRYGENYLHPLT